MNFVLKRQVRKKRVKLTGIHARTKLGLKYVCFGVIIDRQVNVDIMFVWLRIKKKGGVKPKNSIFFLHFEGINRFICSVVIMLFWCTNRTINHSVCRICALNPLTSIPLPLCAIGTTPHPPPSSVWSTDVVRGCKSSALDLQDLC